MTDTLSQMPAVDEETHTWCTDFVIPPKVKAITFDAASYQAWADSLLPELKASYADAGNTREQIAAKNGRLLSDVTRYIPIGTQHILFEMRIPPFRMRRDPSFRYANSLAARRIGNACFEPVSPVNSHERVTMPVQLNARRAVAVGFSDVVYVPVLSEILPACRITGEAELRPWMSLTPLEVFTQRRLIARARGKVGIAGIGMGWFARQVLNRAAVSHVTVVEKNAKIIEYFGSRLLQEYGEHRVTLVHDDAYSHNWHGYDVSLWDIWAAIGEAAWDNKFLRICRELREAGRVCEGWTQRGGYGPENSR